MQRFRKRLFAALAAVVLSSPSAGAATLTLDLCAWDGKSDLPDGWTQSSLEKYASGTLGGAAYFNAENDSIGSPLLSEAIRSVTVESATTSTNLTRQLGLTPVVGGTYGETVFLEPPAGKAFTSQAIDLHELGATRLYLKSTSGLGNWAVRKIIVAYGEASEDDPVEDDPVVDPEPSCTNGWKASEFVPAPGWRQVDLSHFGKVDKQFAWENGPSAGGLYAYVNGAAAEKCLAYSPKAYIGGIYCYDAGTDAARTNEIALLASGTATVDVLLPVRLDTERRLESLAVSFGARQLNPDEAETVLAFDWAVFDEPDAMTAAATVWTRAAEYVAGEAPAAFSLPLPVSSVRCARYVCFRWRVANQANSAMIGLDAIRVTASQLPDGFAIVVR